MMKKYLLDFLVSENLKLNDKSFLLRLAYECILPEILPGQFVEIRVDNSNMVFLRRPVSVHDVDYQNNELSLLIQVVGQGTRKLSELKVGDTLNIIVPLGNSFTFPSEKQKELFLIGGGVGIAPLLYLGRILCDKKYKVNFLLGGKTKQELVRLASFEKYGKVYLTTEDGSTGEKGFVTQHSVLTKHKIDKIYTCGPTPMMKAVANYAQKNNIDCEASLENKMACGIGACLCCVTETKEGHKCVCSEGPVFNTNDLKW